MTARASSEVSSGATVAVDSTDLWFFLAMTPSYARNCGGRAGTRPPDWGENNERIELQQTVPTLSVFFGIVIRMYYDDHPPPHFHAIYGEFEAHIGLDPLEVIKGKLPRRALELVLDWAELHSKELRENWERGQDHTRMFPIRPLE